VFWKELLLIAAVLILRGSVAWRVCCRPKAGVWSRVDRDSKLFSWCGRHHEPLEGTVVPLEVSEGEHRPQAVGGTTHTHDVDQSRIGKPLVAGDGSVVLCNAVVQQQRSSGGFIVASTE